MAGHINHATDGEGNCLLSDCCSAHEEYENCEIHKVEECAQHVCTKCVKVTWRECQGGIRVANTVRDKIDKALNENEHEVLKIIAGCIKKEYDTRNAPEMEDVTEHQKDMARSFDSGFGIALSNLIERIGKALVVQDFDQWRFDCGQLVCGTPQVGICEFCSQLGSVEDKG